MSNLREQIMYELTGGGVNTDFDAAGDKADEILALVIADYEQKVIEACKTVNTDGIHEYDPTDDFIEAIKQVMKDE